MNCGPSIGRRAILRGTAAAAASMGVLSACSDGHVSGAEAKRDDRHHGAKSRKRGSATKPLPVPNQLHESPLIAEQVHSRDLPQLRERLPDHPYVVPHRWVDEGQYGGTLRLITPETGSASTTLYMYGNSPLRWLNDGLDIGPGLVESWDVNDDASRWTLHFRRGLRWSDGKPWTTEDVLFWWKDLILNDDHPATVPDEMRSGKETVAKVTAQDSHTLVLHYDAPAPLTAMRAAAWVNGGSGGFSPAWSMPKHYLKQFHPTYNPEVGKDWATEGGTFLTKSDFLKNPDCPTMTGWRLRSYREGRSQVLERNPYYWCVDRAGNQLPYLDSLTLTAVNDPEVAKLQVQQGKTDYVGPGGFVSLQDISTIKQTQDRNRLTVRLWHSGSGTGSAFFFNYDYHEPGLRALIRKAEFRQALSLAFNRDEARKSIYFNRGEKTTGTLNPQAVQFHTAPDGQQIYRKWRDSYVAYDPSKAKRMLDKLGVVDTNGDGKRELPDGGKLVIRLQFSAGAADEAVHKNNLLQRDWKRIGLEVQLDPVPPDAFAVHWEAGELMTYTDWNVGDVNPLVLPNWLVPIGPSRWAPLEGQYYAQRGTPKAGAEQEVSPYERKPPRMEAEPDGPVAQLWDLYDKVKVEPDEMRRHRIVWAMIKVHISDGPFFMGCVANSPLLQLAHRDLRNVPDAGQLAQGGMAGPWTHPTPAVYDPETWFWSNPDAHS